MPTRIKRLLWAGLIAVALCGCDVHPWSAPTKVVKVYDGDTVRLANGEKLRLLGIDTPEQYPSDKLMRDARRSGEEIAVIQARGKRASEFTRQLLWGKSLRLEYDKEQRDPYGRLLAYAWFEVPEGEVVPLDYAVEEKEKDNGEMGHFVFVNATIVKAGYAVPMIIPPNTRYADRLKRLHREAEAAGRGLWGAP